MKRLIILLLFVCNTVYPQFFNDTINALTFKVEYPADTLTDLDDIDFRREKPVCEFTLGGNTPLKYSMQLHNETIASLSRYENDQWILQEDMKYESYFMYRKKGEDGDEDKLISNFRIEDFDKDGDEDLLCWIRSNMNGNEWTRVFLNDQENKKLVRLINTAYDIDIWDMPRYDEKTGIINCTLHGSAFGCSAESSYKLENLTTTPIEKHYQVRTSGRYVEDLYYTGENGKWKLKKKTKSRD